MHRKDFRSTETFKKDIKFSTNLESFWWSVFMNQVEKHFNFSSVSYESYGVDNTGELVKKSNHNADYKLCFEHDNKKHEILMEIKFAPSGTKSTFKVADLQAYIKQNAHILLFYNIGNKDLKKPKNYELTEHINKIVSEFNNIRYGVIS